MARVLILCMSEQRRRNFALYLGVAIDKNSLASIPVTNESMVQALTARRTLRVALS